MTARLCIVAFLVLAKPALAADPARAIDFNRDVRPILSEKCFLCHGPDPKNRKGLNTPLRLDTEEGATADRDGDPAIVRGKPDDSELMRRITSADDDVMPPAKMGKPLSKTEVETLRRWIAQGAPYAKHWAYVPPKRPDPPAVSDPRWPRNPIDRFTLACLDAEGLKPSPEADRPTLIRRLALDLTGLPPTPEEVEAFVKDTDPNAYENLVDRLLARPSYGEHWGRLWLDLARYADSAGYADDPARTIWAYRDWVVRAFNANMPFDRFTIEQIAGDLLPNPTDDQLIATAFHRNTLTNNEGGTSDEEFRNVAVVDRVNTTMAVWMGTTMACAQCHDHKYDPLSQKEYFQLFAFFNNTQDADRTDESPLLAISSPEKKAKKAALEAEIARLETVLKTPTPALVASQAKWAGPLSGESAWGVLKPADVTSGAGSTVSTLEDGSVRLTPTGKAEVVTVLYPIREATKLTALRLGVLPDDMLPGRGPGHAPNGNFVISRVKAAIAPPGPSRPSGRYLRVELPGKGKMLSLAEVEVFRGPENLARGGSASQSSTDYDGQASRAIDGNTDGHYTDAMSTTHTKASDDPWWEVDLKAESEVDRVVVWNRTDNALQGRLSGFRVSLLDEDRRPVWTETVATPPNPSVQLAATRTRPIEFASAVADYAQPEFPAMGVLDNADPANRGWAVGGAEGRPHALTLLAKEGVAVEAGSTLTLTIEQLYKQQEHTLGRFRLEATGDERAASLAMLPAPIVAILKTPADKRSAAQKAELTRFYLAEVAPELKEAREGRKSAQAQLAAIKPDTTVPILKETDSSGRRATRIQIRGDFLSLGEEVREGVPAAFHPLPSDAPKDRLALARWLVSEENPLAARVVANRDWEQIFGTGLVASSEEFGAQGDLPSHPELLDWLATELQTKRWDLKKFLRLIVTSATYRQSSRVDPEMARRDPDNRLLARGPRLRLPAETIRDQALAVSGLLSTRMGGPPVKPPQPASGLSAAFGSGIDWETSKGEDRYRRGLYTTWRRSNPYPSMTTFDAPNREVCTLRRTRTNTPLQALVTLNDPVYVEAAQALARRMNDAGEHAADKARRGFRLALARDPNESELGRLMALHDSARATFAREPAKAEKLATEPLGPLPKGADAPDLAAWTVVANVILNLDETLMKP